MRAFAGLLCGLLGLVPGAAAYEPDVFGTAGQVAGQAVYDLGGSGLPCRGGPPPTELSLRKPSSGSSATTHRPASPGPMPRPRRPRSGSASPPTCRAWTAVSTPVAATATWIIAMPLPLRRRPSPPARRQPPIELGAVRLRPPQRRPAQRPAVAAGGQRQPGRDPAEHLRPRRPGLLRRPRRPAQPGRPASGRGAGGAEPEAADAKYRAGAAAFPIACRRRPRCPRRASPRSAMKAP